MEPNSFTEDLDTLFERAHQQRGPVYGRGPGQPWRGIVERTPCLWITWVTDATKRVGISPDQLTVEFYGVPIEMTWVQITFGKRWYWLCPRCGRRCEAVYYAGAVGCRVCLHLGYISQCHRPSSAWLWIDRMNTRHWPLSQRYDPTDEAQAIVKALGKALREELRALVAQIVIKPAGDAQAENGKEG